jgi:hypothetical protein
MTRGLVRPVAFTRAGTCRSPNKAGREARSRASRLRERGPSSRIPAPAASRAAPGGVAAGADGNLWFHRRRSDRAYHASRGGQDVRSGLRHAGDRRRSGRELWLPEPGPWIGRGRPLSGHSDIKLGHERTLTTPDCGPSRQPAWAGRSISRVDRFSPAAPRRLSVRQLDGADRIARSLRYLMGGTRNPSIAQHEGATVRTTCQRRTAGPVRAAWPAIICQCAQACTESRRNSIPARCDPGARCPPRALSERSESAITGHTNASS